MNAYGATKLAFESALTWYGAAYGLRSVSLRYFNVAGATAAHGEDHRPETHLVPNLLTAVQTGRPMTVMGDDYPTRDGTCVRDYIHVEDLADAHLAALELPGMAAPGSRSATWARAPASRSGRCSTRSRPPPAGRCRTSSARAVPATRPRSWPPTPAPAEVLGLDASTGHAGGDARLRLGLAGGPSARLRGGHRSRGLSVGPYRAPERRPAYDARRARSPSAAHAGRRRLPRVPPGLAPAARPPSARAALDQGPHRGAVVGRPPGPGPFRPGARRGRSPLVAAHRRGRRRPGGRLRGGDGRAPAGRTGSGRRDRRLAHHAGHPQRRGRHGLARPQAVGRGRPDRPAGHTR